MNNKDEIIALLKTFGLEYDMDELNEICRKETKKKRTKKCILFARVSSYAQDTTPQKDTMLEEAYRCGYTKDNIIIIDHKESAIKLDEDERLGIIELKRVIEENDVDNVIVFEISRISRRPKVLYSVRDYLMDKNINLICMKPYMRLLDGDGKMSQTANILFSMFSAIAESEMMLKMERMQAHRRLLWDQNKLASGRPMFGYTKDPKTKYVIPHETQAQVVQEIFHLYNENHMAMGEIYNLYVSKGFFKDKKKSAAKNTILRILKNKAYTGDYSSYDKIKAVKYPALISKELYDKTQELLKERFFAPKKVHKNIYYAKGLLRLEQTGLIMQAHITNLCYKSFEVYKCSINMNAVDTSVWLTAKILFMIQNEIDRLETPYDYKEEIAECEERIKNIEKLIEDSRQKQKKAFKLYLGGMVDENIYNTEVSRLKESEATWSSEIASIETEINRYRMMNSESNERGVINPRNLDSLADKQRKEMIDSLIEEIKIKHEADGSFTWVFIPKNKKVWKIYKEMNNSVWKYKTRAGKMVLEETGDKWSNQVNIENRIGGHKLL